MARDQKQRPEHDRDLAKDPAEKDRQHTQSQERPVPEERRRQPGSESGEEPLTQSGNQQIALEE